MRRLVTWLVVSLGIAAILRRLRRRSQQGDGVESPESVAEADAEDDPADELRRKLAESRGDATPSEPPPAEATVEERRASVHDEGRSTLDEMRGADEG